MTDIAQLWQKLKPHAVRDLLVSGVGGGGASGGGLSAHALNGPYHTGTLAESQAPWAVTTSAFSAHTSNPNAHHSRQHDIVGASDHTITGAALSLVGATASNTLGLITPSNNPGAVESVLKATDGLLTLPNITLTTKVTTPHAGSPSAFTSGFTGAGYRLDDGLATAGKTTLELDEMIVRGRMRVYELLIHQIRATNGSVFVTGVGKAKTVTGSGPYTIVTETDHGFAANDLIRAQRFTGSGVYQSNLQVTSVATTTQFTATLASGDAPAAGMEFVRLGNTSNSTRQGSIYLTADDTFAPAIDILDGVSSFAEWGAASKIKARLGKLSSSLDATLSPNGYGLYSQNVFLKGDLVAAAGAVTLTAGHGADLWGWKIQTGDPLGRNRGLNFTESGSAPGASAFARIQGWQITNAGGTVEQNILRLWAGFPDLDTAVAQLRFTSLVGAGSALLDANYATVQGSTQTRLGNTPGATIIGGASITAENHLLPDVDVTKNLGSAVLRWGTLYVNQVVAGTISGTTMSGAEWEYLGGNMVIDANGASNTTVSIVNQGSGQASLDVEKDIVVGGLVDGVDVAAFKSSYDSHIAAADPHGGYLLATGARTGATSQAQTFTNGIVGPTWRPAANSTTALRLQNVAGSASILTLDTTNNRVGINTTPGAYALDVTGAGRFSTDVEIGGELLAANGTVGAPSIAATGDTNTGLYWSAADTLAITTGGAQRAAFSATGLAVTGSVSLTGTITGSLGLWSITNIGVGSFSALTTTAGVSAPQITAAANLLLAPTTDVLLDPGSNLVKLTSGVALQSDNYVSQTTGLRLTYDGQIDAGYVSVKELHAKAFIADLQMALAGGQIITPSVAELYSNFTCPAYSASATLTVRDLPSAAGMQVFPNGTMVRVASINRSGGTMTITAAFGTVTLDTSYGISGFDSATKTQRFTFARPAALFGGGMAAGTTVAPDAIILCYGVSGSGYIETTAVDGLYGANSPYIQIATWVGSPGLATVRSRWGNLNGLSIADYGLVMGSDVGLSSTRTFDFRASTGNLALGANGGAIMLQGDGSSYFSGVMTIGSTGGIYQGSGSFASPTTGLKIWNDSGVGRIGGYNAGTVQWYANTDGKLYAGGGNALLDSNGISVVGDGVFRIMENASTLKGYIYSSNPLDSAVLASTGVGIKTNGTAATEGVSLRAKSLSGRTTELAIDSSTSGRITGYVANGTTTGQMQLSATSFTLALNGTGTTDFSVDGSGNTYVNGDLEVVGNLTGSWSALTLTSGWGNYGAPHAAAAHRAFGNLVVLRGLVIATSGSPSTHIATIPSGKRPNTQMIFICMTNGGGKRVDIKTNGDILPNGWTPVLNDWITFDNVSFYTN